MKGNFTVLLVGLCGLVCGLGLFFAGCSDKSDNSVGAEFGTKNTAPFPPQGVGSITGNNCVIVHWLPNWESELGEKDLAGYIVYRGLNETSDFQEIGRVNVNTNSFTDNTAQNGTTYYYAVCAFDTAGNESELSVENVFDTPCPNGANVRLTDYTIAPEASGFSFTHSNRVQAWDNSTTDLYFGVDTEVAVPYIYSDTCNIQDMGWTESMDEISYSPTQGFTSLFVEAIVGHTYVFITPEGNYAKIRITDLKIDWVGDSVSDATVCFDWAYQLQTGNPELAPKK